MSDRARLSESEQQVIKQAYDLIEAVYGQQFRNLAAEREPDMTRWILEEGIEAFDDEETLTERNVPQIAEVIATKTLGSTRPSLYHRRDQDPFERSIYGV